MQNKEIIMDEKDIDRSLTRIAHAISETHHGIENLVLIGIRTGGAYLAKRLQEKMYQAEGINLPYGSVDINLYRDDWTKISHHPVLQGTEITFSIDEKSVILIDDVLFTGRTVRAAMDAIIDIGRPSRIELAVLIDRGHRELPIQANYCGKVLETKLSQRINVFLKENDHKDEVVIESYER